MVYNLYMIFRIALLALISLSITLIYYVKVIRADFDILQNPDGPDTSDYFLEDTGT